MSTVLETDAARVVVNPTFGARVVSLIDKANGRDWMAPGGESFSTGEDAVFLADESVGWDECFPTVSPWDASRTAWGRPLRDHGDLWGRPWQVEEAGGTNLTTIFLTNDYRFSRRLSLAGATLTAAYSLENRGSKDLPWMWSMHALLAVTGADRIVLPDVGTVAATFVALGGRPLAVGGFAWPGPGGGVPFALDAVQSCSLPFAGKFYAADMPSSIASVGGETGWLDLGWNPAQTPFLGIWLNYGGWPNPGPLRQIAIEPTTAPVDHLGQAIDTGTARLLHPGSKQRWTVTMTLRR